MLYMGEGSERERAMVLAPLSAGFQSLPPLPTIKLVPSCADSRVGGWVCVCSGTLWVSPTNSSVRLGVSPAAASTPTGVFSQWFEALFPHVGTPGCAVYPPSPPAAASRASCSFAHPAPQSATSLGLPAATLPQVLSARLPASILPTGLDGCFFFISLVVGLPYSLIFCQFCFFFFF